MNKGLLIAIGAVIIAGGAYSFVMADKKAAMKAEEMEAKEMMEKEAMEKAAMEEAATASPDDAAMMKKDGEMMDGEMDKKMDGDMMKDDMNKEVMDDAAMMKKAGAYLPYEASKVAMASEGDVVLFFRASWCPSCRALDTDIKANLGAIPAGVTILDVDYDAQIALKQKYGVTTQHTLVQVAADGSLIKKWSGGSTLASVVGQIE